MRWGLFSTAFQSSWQTSAVFRYACPVLMTALAVLARLVLNPTIGNEAPFLLFFPAVLVSAWYGGLGPGMLATALSTLASLYFFLFLFPISTSAGWIQFLLLITFILEGSLISLIMEAGRQAGISLRQAKDELELQVAGRTVELAQANAQLQVDLAERQRIEEALQESENRFRSVVESANDAIILADGNGSIIGWNKGAYTIFGYQAAEVLGQPLTILMPERYTQAHRQGLERYQVTGEAHVIGKAVELEGRRKDGGEFPLELSLNTWKTGESRFFSGIIRDITRRKETAAGLEQANQKLVSWVQQLENHAHEITLLSEMGDLLQACSTTEEAYATIAHSVQLLFPTESGALYVLSASRNIAEAAAIWGGTLQAGEGVFAPEECWALRRGRLHQVENSATGPVCQHLKLPAPTSYLCVPMMAQGEALGVLHLRGSAENRNPGPGEVVCLTESQQRLAVTVAEHIALALSNLRLRETLRSQAIRDPLTGLFNRRYMEESLEREVRRSTRRNTSLAVVMLDLDHYKEFNDAFGHDAGDTLLREFGIFLRSHTRGEDIACRYGGEEFVLVLPEVTLDVARQRAEQLREGAKHLDVQHHGRALGVVTLSAGVIVFPKHGTTAESLLSAADTALYQAKRAGRDRVVVG
ncbi:MAG: diguanylate cyclase [Chloroflexi bacterium]|nr:diguanylate cyclase [Chloroflexota bacterium]